MNIQVAVVADFSKSIAVWHALKLHINFIHLAGVFPVIYVKDEVCYEMVKKDLPNYNIVVYYSILNLRKILSKNNNIQYVWCPNFISVLKVSFIKREPALKVIYWIQGIIPEESYLKHKNKFRFYVLCILEKFALRLTDKYVFVSESMKSFLENKYKITFTDYIVVPCVSELKYNPDIKKIKKSFVYIGGISVWQCFDEILRIFHQIKNIIPDAIFHIITPEVEKAKHKVFIQFQETKNIQIYEIKDRSLLSDVLSRFEYGFLIRKNSNVNKVASPIKFAEYLSCDINVIMTASIPHFAKLLIANNAGIVLDDSLRIPNLNAFNYNKTNALDVYSKYFNFAEQPQKYWDMLCCD